MTVEPEIRQLRYFEAVARHRNFSRAASELHISQQALSQQVKRLETQLGVTLMERSTRSVELTNAGEVLLAESRRLIAAMDRAVARTVAAADEDAEINLAFTLTTASQTVPRILALAAETTPRFAISAREMFAADLEASLLSFTIDLAVAPRAQTVEDIRLDPVREERLVAAFAEDHPLASADSVALEELASETFQLWPREMSPGYFDAVVDACRAAGFEPRLDDSGGGAPVWGRIAAGGTIGLIARSQRESLRAGIVTVPVSDLSAVMPIDLFSRADEPDATVRDARDQLVAIAGRIWGDRDDPSR